MVHSSKWLADNLQLQEVLLHWLLHNNTYIPHPPISNLEYVGSNLHSNFSFEYCVLLLDYANWSFPNMSNKYLIMYQYLRTQSHHGLRPLCGHFATTFQRCCDQKQATSLRPKQSNIRMTKAIAQWPLSGMWATTSVARRLQLLHEKNSLRLKWS